MQTNPHSSTYHPLHPQAKMSDLDTQDDTYVSRPGEKQDAIPVQSDDADVETGIDAKTADSEEQLGMYLPRANL